MTDHDHDGAGEWMLMCDEGNRIFFLESADESMVDAAVSLWIDSGCTRDTLLMLNKITGGWIKMRASMIVSWTISTPEIRAQTERHNAIYGDALDTSELGWRATDDSDDCTE